MAISNLITYTQLARRSNGMNNNALILLGCSSSLSLVLFTSHVANAAPVVPQDGRFVGATEAAVQTANVSPDQEHPQDSVLASPDREGDLAITKFGCDCPGCRRVVNQMVEQDSSTLPQ